MKKMAIDILLVVVATTAMSQRALALDEVEAEEAIVSACDPAALGDGGRAALAKASKTCVEVCEREMDNESSSTRRKCESIVRTARSKDVGTHGCNKENECMYLLS